MTEKEDGILPYPLNWLFVIGLVLSLLVILWEGLGIGEDLEAIWQMILTNLGVV